MNRIAASDRTVKTLQTDVKIEIHVSPRYRLVGLVVMASASRAEDLGFNSRLLRGDFFRVKHTSDLKLGTPGSTLPGAWRYKVSAGTGWPLVSILSKLCRQFDLQLLSQCRST